MINKIWEFIKKNWLALLAFLGGLIAGLKFLENEREADVARKKKEMEDKIKEAEEEERRKVEAARLKAEAEQKARDEEIRKKKAEEEAKLAQEIEKKVEETVEKSGSEQAQEFANAFGGTYVKNDEK